MRNKRGISGVRNVCILFVSPNVLGEFSCLAEKFGLSYRLGDGNSVFLVGGCITDLPNGSDARALLDKCLLDNSARVLTPGVVRERALVQHLLEGS